MLPGRYVSEFFKTTSLRGLDEVPSFGGVRRPVDFFMHVLSPDTTPGGNSALRFPGYHRCRTMDRYRHSPSQRQDLSSMTSWQDIQRWTGRVLFGALLLTLLAFAADWGIWRIQLAHGAGTSTVQVTRLVVAPLKGNREEYYMDGTEDRACSRSIFPQGDNQPCWWLRRHRVIFVR